MFASTYTRSIWQSMAPQRNRALQAWSNLKVFVLCWKWKINIFMTESDIFFGFIKFVSNIYYAAWAKKQIVSEKKLESFYNCHEECIFSLNFDSFILNGLNCHSKVEKKSLQIFGYKLKKMTVVGRLMRLPSKHTTAPRWR